MKQKYISEKITTNLFYLSAFLFFIAFNFQDSKTSGWYQQFLPNLGGRSISDVFFLDSLTGWAVTPYTTQNDTAFVLKTTNGGDNWFISNVRTGQYVGYNKIKFLNSQTGFTCGVSQSSGFKGLNKSTDGGYNWVSLNVPNPYIVCYDMSVINQDTIWVVDNESLTGGAFLTTNGGVSWQQKFAGGTENPNKIYMYNARIGFIKNINNGTSLKKTTNGGENWTPLDNSGFYEMYMIDSLTGWIAGGYVKKTTNGGLNWVQQTLPQGIPGHTLVNGFRSISKISRDTIWGSWAYVIFPNLQGRGVLYRTTNGGTNWLYQIPDTSFHIGGYYYTSFLNNKTGWEYSPNTSGIHTTVGGDTTFLSSIRQISNKVPSEYRLFQNYPNPFNPVSSIKYQVSRSVEVKIIVFDIAGKEIKTLVNKKQSSGTYEVTFDGNNLSSGIYFYSLFVEGARIDTKKMVLIK